MYVSNIHSGWCNQFIFARYQYCFMTNICLTCNLPSLCIVNSKSKSILQNIVRQTLCDLFSLHRTRFEYQTTYLTYHYKLCTKQLFGRQGSATFVVVYVVNTSGALLHKHMLYVAHWLICQRQRGRSSQAEASYTVILSASYSNLYYVLYMCDKHPESLKYRACISKNIWSPSYIAVHRHSHYVTTPAFRINRQCDSM